MAGVATWTQDCHDWNRSGWSPVDPVEGLTFAWQWNGSDGTGGLGTASSGPAGNHAFDAPREARPVCSPTMVFAPEGISPDDATVRAPYGIYALTKSTGALAWTWPSTTNTQNIQCSPAYDATTDTLLVGSTDGFVYKLTAATGAVAASYNAGSAIRKAVAIFNGYVYVVCDDGTFHKIQISSMTLASGWTAKYASASVAQTPPVFCVSTGLWVYCTADLYVHCVKDADGTRAWRVKPTTNVPTTDAVSKPLYTYTYGVPVIAEMHQMAFVVLRSYDDRNGSGYGSMARTGNLTPGTQAEIRTWIQANLGQQSLFAMKLSDGTQPFIPATTWGSNEDVSNPGGADGSHIAYGTIGQWPIVHVYPNGDEVLYCTFKSFLAATNTTFAAQGTDDGRWAKALGEMVMDSTTVSGMSPGDFRFVRAANFVGSGNTGTYQGKSMAIYIADEQSPLSGAASSIFNTHWLVGESWNITDRSASKGYNQPFNPIVTTDRRIHMHSPKNAAAYAANHTDAATSNPGTQEEDTSSRTWPVTGLTYSFDKTGVSRPPLSTGIAGAHAAGYYWNTTAFSVGFRPRYTIVSDGHVLIVGNGGEITAFTHSGTGGATTIGIAA